MNEATIETQAARPAPLGAGAPPSHAVRLFEQYRERVESIVREPVVLQETVTNYTTRTYTITIKKPDSEYVVTSFILMQLPGCCGVALSTAARVYVPYIRHGLGTLLNQFRIDLARAQGYGIILCTDVERNAAERKILTRNGWKDIYSFTNPRTSNQVNISVKELK